MVELAEINTALGAAKGVRELGGWLLAAIRWRKRKQHDVAPGDWQSRYNAYRRFHDAGLQVASDLHLVAIMGAPPRLAGALLSWPIALRSSRRITEAFTEVLGGLSEIAMVGDDVVGDAALAAAVALGEAAQSFPHRRGGGELPADFAQQLQDANERLVDFVVAVRTDLGRKDK